MVYCTIRSVESASLYETETETVSMIAIIAYGYNIIYYLHMVSLYSDSFHYY